MVLFVRPFGSLPCGVKTKLKCHEGLPRAPGRDLCPVCSAPAIPLPPCSGCNLVLYLPLILVHAVCPSPRAEKVSHIYVPFFFLLGLLNFKSILLRK